MWLRMQLCGFCNSIIGPFKVSEDYTDITLRKQSQDDKLQASVPVICAVGPPDDK